MAKIVGLSRNLKLQWLNKVAELVMDGHTEEEIKNQLNEYLGFEIGSPTNIRKTREILMNIWVYENAYSKNIKTTALELIELYPEHSIEIHWCMMLAAYPVFGDMCKLVGKISEFQDEIALSLIKQKLFDEWGERTTLYHSIDKLVATFKSLDVLSSNKPGKYLINKHRVTNTKIIMFMVYTVMLVDGGSYYAFANVNASNYLFPFEYVIEKEVLLDDVRFNMSIFGGELSISLK